MTTYRTGNHWGVTIVREPEDCDCRVDESSLNRFKFHQGCHAVRAQLVAVVVNGDTALAERICALLNRDERMRAVMAEVEHGRATYQRGGRISAPSAEGADGDAPSSPLSAPVSAQQPPVGGKGCTEGAETLSGDPAITPDRHCRKCGATVESVTAEPHHEMPHSNGLYMVTMSVLRTLHPCGHGYITATGAVI